MICPPDVRLIVNQVSTAHTFPAALWLSPCQIWHRPVCSRDGKEDHLILGGKIPENELSSLASVSHAT